MKSVEAISAIRTCYESPSSNTLAKKEAKKVIKKLEKVGAVAKTARHLSLGVFDTIRRRRALRVFAKMEPSILAEVEECMSKESPLAPPIRHRLKQGRSAEGLTSSLTNLPTRGQHLSVLDIPAWYLLPNRYRLLNRIPGSSLVPGGSSGNSYVD